MARIIKVTCTGPDQHVNDIDLERALRTDDALRLHSGAKAPPLPERLVLPCRVCTLGKVVITRAMIEATPSKDKK